MTRFSWIALVLAAASLTPSSLAFDVVVFGSSVSRGFGEPSLNGYSKQLQTEIWANRGESLLIEGVNGFTTTTTYNYLVSEMDWYEFVPTTVIIGLSTANEGLPDQTTLEDAEALAASYENGIELIVNTTLDYGVKNVLVGSVYPHNSYTALQYGVLLEVFARQSSRLPELGIARGDDITVQMVDFLTNLDDGSGHWQAGLYANAGHPNLAGYTRMFEELNTTYYDVVTRPYTRLEPTLEPTLN